MFARYCERLTRRQVAFMVVMLALVAGAISLCVKRIDVVVSGSLSHRVFILCPPQHEYKTGDFVVFRYDREDKFMESDMHLQKRLDKTRYFTKEVGCSPGERLTVDTYGRFACDGKLLGVALRTDSHGNRLPLFGFNGVIPQENYFVIGANPRSFDSKYFGFVKKDEILYQAYPIW